MAAARQLFAVAPSHFYDNLLCLSLSIEERSGQMSLRLFALEQGNVLDDDKHFTLHPTFTFVGCFVRAWDLFDTGRSRLSFEPKEGRADKFLAIRDSIEEKRDVSAEAVSLLRKLGHLGGTLAGRVLRG